MTYHLFKLGIGDSCPAKIRVRVGIDGYSHGGAKGETLFTWSKTHGDHGSKESKNFTRTTCGFQGTLEVDS